MLSRRLLRLLQRPARAMSAGVQYSPGLGERVEGGAGQRRAGIPSDEKQATGLEWKTLEIMKKGQDPYNIFKPKVYAGIREDSPIVPSVTKQRLVGCIYMYQNNFV
ncbi:cytochrome c oxidase subunit 5B, mitochondrial-like [Emydura macquarii macquarii]|uniref:cytochrome c oxidase subunit 5B, mitochondrial-like n=1 Tax=Emydura macquarii macquarii TaxID=1129001 RepID=UPI00352BCF00